jgi:hypothetical protein
MFELLTAELSEAGGPQISNLQNSAARRHSLN